MNGQEANLSGRKMMSPDEAWRLQELFKLLANDTRLRLLHALAIQGETAAGQLADFVGMKPPAVSAQLRRLQAAGIVRSRRDATNKLYRVVDPFVLNLMERGFLLLDGREDFSHRTRSRDGD